MSARAATASLGQELFLERMGAEAERYFKALDVIAEAHARYGAPRLGWRVGVDSVLKGKSVDILIGETK